MLWIGAYWASCSSGDGDALEATGTQAHRLTAIVAANADTQGSFQDSMGSLLSGIDMGRQNGAGRIRAHPSYTRALRKNVISTPLPRGPLTAAFARARPCPAPQPHRAGEPSAPPAAHDRHALTWLARAPRAPVGSYHAHTIG